MTIPLYEELDPSPADIAMRICELGNDEYIVAPFEPIHTSDDDDIGFRMGTVNIMRFICAETDFETYDGEESDAKSFTYYLSMVHDAVRDWLFQNVNEVITFAASSNTIHVEHLQSGAYKIASLSKISASECDQYILRNMVPAEIKKRKMLLAALAALRHERSAEIAYLKNDIAAFAVHLSYMWRSYARLATYPALHDGRALEMGRPKGGGPPKKDRRALKRLLEKFCPDYLNEDIPYRQLWEKIRGKLEAAGTVTRCGSSQFYFQFEPTNGKSSAGSIIEIPPKGEEKPLGFIGFYRVVRSMRELR